MRADQRKFHYIYKITRIDGAYYIGLHSTDDLEDGYFGSGQRLWKSIKKHGKDKHVMEILEFLQDRKTLKKREAELVDANRLKDPLCMNLALGGQCRNPLTEEEKEMVAAKQRGRKLSDEHKKKLSEAAKNMSYEVRSKISEGGKRRFSSDDSRKEHGEKIKLAMSNDVKRKMSDAAKRVNAQDSFRTKKSNALKQFNANLSDDVRKERAKHLTSKFPPGSEAAKERAKKIQESIKRNKEMRNAD